MPQEYGFALPRPTLAYGTAAIGEWRLVRSPAGISSSYISRHAIERDHMVLRQGDVDWMATSLLELESHAWHLSRSRGVVVAAGLGMAFFAHAAASRPDVERVIVAEIDPAVPRLLDLACPGWEMGGKIETIVADAGGEAFADEVRRRLGGRRPDYLYADVWSAYPDPDAPGWTSGLAGRLDPHEAGWWGQELSLALDCADRDQPISGASFDAYFARYEVPASRTEGYLDFCRAAADTHLGEDAEADLGPL